MEGGEHYLGYYWKPKIAKKGPKQHNKLSFLPEGKKKLGQSPPQELEVARSAGGKGVVCGRFN